MSETTPRRPGAWPILALVSAMLLLSLPDVADVTRYHGDERFYTDAALGMWQSGDWWLPRYPDGSVRVQKPIASYLVIASSYELLGPSLFASRLPFLLAGCALVWLTWRMAWSWLRDERAALLAAAIVAVSPDVQTLSLRSTPDILLCLAVAASLHGFAALLRGDRSVGAPMAWAWLGLGLAGAVKGALVVPLLLYVGAWARFGRNVQATPGRLLHPFWTPVAVLLAVSGFGVYALVADVGVLGISFRDQTGGTELASPGTVLSQLARYTLVPLEHLLPWTAFLALGVLADRGPLRRFAARRRFELAFPMGWALVLVGVFSLGSLVRARYLAPAYAPLAVPLAGALVAMMREGRSGAWIRMLAQAVLGLVALLALVLLAGGARIDARLVLAGLVVGATAVAAAWVARRGGGWNALMAVAATALVILTLGEWLVRGAFSRNPVPLLAERLLEPELVDARVAQIGQSGNLAAKLRLATGGRVEIVGHPRGTNTLDWERWDVVVSDEAIPAEAQEHGFVVEPVGESWGDDWTGSEIWQVVSAEDPDAVLARRAQPHYLARRTTPRAR